MGKRRSSSLIIDSCFLLDILYQNLSVKWRTCYIIHSGYWQVISQHSTGLTVKGLLNSNGLAAAYW